MRRRQWWTVAVCGGLAAALVGCGESGASPINCGGTMVWTAIAGEVVAMGEIVDGDRDRHATVIVRDTEGSEQTIEVWGRPDLLRFETDYQFQVEQSGDAFVQLTRDLACADDVRQSTNLDGTEITVAE